MSNSLRFIAAIGVVFVLGRGTARAQKAPDHSCRCSTLVTKMFRCMGSLTTDEEFWRTATEDRRRRNNQGFMPGTFRLMRYTLVLAVM
jgi:hypothetical protein